MRTKHSSGQNQSTHALSGTLTHLNPLEKLRWSNDELPGTSVIDTTIPAVYQICSIYNKLTITCRTQTSYKIGYDVQSIIPSCCCTIRHINSFRHKDQEISPPNIQANTYFQRHIQIFILSIHNTTVEPTPYKYTYSRPYTFSRQLQRTANTCCSLQPIIVFFNINIL